MYRVVYCPDHSQLEVAEILSKKTFLPILVGDNLNTEKLFFDRESVSIIAIPELENLQYDEKNIKKGMHQFIKYTNEFSNIKNNIRLEINSLSVKSLYEETHCAKFIYKCEESGFYSCIIYINNEIKKEFNFVVD